MKTLIVLMLIAAVAACGGKQAVRVNCDRRLVPINDPAAVISDVPMEGSAAEELQP